MRFQPSRRAVRRAGVVRKAEKTAMSIMGAEGWMGERSGRGKRSWMYVCERSRSVFVVWGERMVVRVRLGDFCVG